MHGKWDETIINEQFMHVPMSCIKHGISRAAAACIRIAVCDASNVWGELRLAHQCAASKSCQSRERGQQAAISQPPHPRSCFGPRTNDVGHMGHGRRKRLSRRRWSYLCGTAGHVMI